MNIKQKTKNLVSYFRRAWATSKTYLFVNLIRNIFTAAISLINIVGLGTVVDALTSGKSKEDVLQVILVYLSVNLLITLINQALLLWENSAMRKASNVLPVWIYARLSWRWLSLRSGPKNTEFKKKIDEFTARLFVKYLRRMF